MYFVKLGFSSTSRKFQMPVLPRVGELIDFDDGEDDRIVLKIKRLVHILDDGTWTYFCQCDVQSNWLE